MYYAYIHEIRLSSVAVFRAEGSKQDAPTPGKSLDSLSRLHQDTGRRCWTVRKQPKSRVQISLLFFFLLCSPSFLLNFSPFFLGADLPFQLCLILEDRTTYHSMSTTPFRQNEKKYSSKSIHFSFFQGRVSRSYRLHVPKHWPLENNQPLPLLLDFHGWTQHAGFVELKEKNRSRKG